MNNSEKQKYIQKFQEKVQLVYGVEGNFSFEKLKMKASKHEKLGEDKKIGSSSFMKFATIDYQELNSHKSLVDCLSNCKRALAAKFDELIKRMGLEKLSKKKNWSFNNKFEIISECGVVTPKILSKINKLRNKLEHEYKAPEKHEVEEAYEITALFVGYANSIPSYNLPMFTWGLNNTFKVFLERSELVFKFLEREKEEDDYKTVCRIESKEEEFKTLLDFFIKLNNATSS